MLKMSNTYSFGNWHKLWALFIILGTDMNLDGGMRFRLVGSENLVGAGKSKNRFMLSGHN